MVAGDPNMLLSPLRMIAGNAQMSRPTAGCGTVNASAVVLTPQRIVDGRLVNDSKLRVAIDASSVTATGPDRIRFDFFNEGRFREEFSTPLKTTSQQPNYCYCSFGPATFTVTTQGTSIPVTVLGYYMVNDNKYVSLSLAMTTGAQGPCTIGNHACSVRLLDGNNNLLLGESPRANTTGTALADSGDTLLIDTGDGSFRRITARAFYGQPAFIEGAWYQLRMNADHSAFVATPFPGDLGTVNVPHAQWSGIFIGANYVLNLSGTAADCALPADTYHVTSYTENMRATSNQSAFLTCIASPGTSKSLPVTANTRTTLDIGSPLYPIVRTAQKAGEVTFSLDLQDKSGNTVSNVFVPGNNGVNTVKFAVYNTQGEKVYENTFEHG